MGQVKLQHRQCNRHTYTLSMYVHLCTEYTNLGGARDSHYVITPPTICIIRWTQPPTLKHSATAGMNCLQYWAQLVRYNPLRIRISSGAVKLKDRRATKSKQKRSVNFYLPELLQPSPYLFVLVLVA